MSTDLAKEKSFLKDVSIITCPEELDLDYVVLDSSDEAVLIDAAECLAETFAGTSINGVTVSEPMTNACGLTKEDMLQFVTEYLKNVVDQGFCYVAKDKETGRVIGTLACEDFNPDEEIPVFEGKLKALNTIIEFLVDIDTRLVNTIKLKTGSSVAKNEYIHTFMCGVRMKKHSKFVFVRLFQLLTTDSHEKEYKGIFGEATNFKSIKLMTDYCGFHPVYDQYNNPIQSIYAEHETFKSISHDVATDCRMLYRPLSSEYDI